MREEEDGFAVQGRQTRRSFAKRIHDLKTFVLVGAPSGIDVIIMPWGRNDIDVVCHGGKARLHEFLHASTGEFLSASRLAKIIIRTCGRKSNGPNSRD